MDHRNHSCMERPRRHNGPGRPRGPHGTQARRHRGGNTHVSADCASHRQRSRGHTATQPHTAALCERCAGFCGGFERFDGGFMSYSLAHGSTLVELSHAQGFRRCAFAVSLGFGCGMTSCHIGSGHREKAVAMRRAVALMALARRRPSRDGRSASARLGASGRDTALPTPATECCSLRFFVRTCWSGARGRPASRGSTETWSSGSDRPSMLERRTVSLAGGRVQRGGLWPRLAAALPQACSGSQTPTRAAMLEPDVRIRARGLSTPPPTATTASGAARASSMGWEATAGRRSALEYPAERTRLRCTDPATRLAPSTPVLVWQERCWSTAPSDVLRDVPSGGGRSGIDAAWVSMSSVSAASASRPWTSRRAAATARAPSGSVVASSCASGPASSRLLIGEARNGWQVVYGAPGRAARCLRNAVSNDTENADRPGDDATA